MCLELCIFKSLIRQFVHLNTSLSLGLQVLVDKHIVHIDHSSNYFTDKSSKCLIHVNEKEGSFGLYLGLHILLRGRGDRGRVAPCLSRSLIVQVHLTGVGESWG